MALPISNGYRPYYPPYATPTFAPPVGQPTMAPSQPAYAPMPQSAPQMGIQGLFARIVDWFKRLFSGIGGKTSLNVPKLYQYEDGQQNACGTTSLAMVMNYLGVPDSRRTIDAMIRRTDTFTAPRRMVDYARSRGLAAESYNSGTFEEVRGFLDRRLPVIMLIEPSTPNDVNLHYVVVKGYEKNPDGTYSYLVQDPAKSTPDDRRSEAELYQQWSNLRLSGIGTGIDRYFMVAAPQGTQLPPRRTAGVAEDVADLGSTVMNGVEAVKKGNIADALPAIGGLIQLIGGLFGQPSGR